MKLELEAGATGATGATAPGAGDPTLQPVQERCRVTLARYEDPSTFSSSARCRFNLELPSFGFGFGLVLEPRPENGLQMALAGSCQTKPTLPKPGVEQCILVSDCPYLRKPQPLLRNVPCEDSYG